MSTKIEEKGTVGIDAGGTFTDLVFLGGHSQSVRAQVKVPTDPDHLLRTIKEGLELLLKTVEKEAVQNVNLATTLVTNAIVEHRLRPSAIVLIGYHTDLVTQVSREVGAEIGHVIQVCGGHTSRGDEAAPLDEAALEQALEELEPGIWSIAVSGFFSVRNPAHELEAARIIRQRRPNAFVTCGHDLASSLDAVKRAATAALNAGLIPIVMDLLEAVRRVLEGKQISVPVSIVRGDGSLVSAEWAAQHPVEMILSGPAASACGACFLAEADRMGRSAWVTDIGGTTTDIIRLDRRGKPALCEEGAAVGGYRTLVRAIDIDTFGLGGDSRIHYRQGRQLVIGPRRVQPLCVTASEHPEIIKEMRLLLEMGACGEPLALLASDREWNGPGRELLERLRCGPRMVQPLLAEASSAAIFRMQLEKMESAGVIRFSAFTLTDALHLAGRLNKWNAEASRLGAELLSGQYTETPEELLAEISRTATDRIGLALVKKSFAAAGLRICENGEGEHLIKAALSNSSSGSDGAVIRLNASLIGVGAPAWALVPEVGGRLQETAVLPDHAEVAGAVGAASGTFFLQYTVRIDPNEDGTYRVHSPFGIKDYELLEEAVAETCRFMEPWLSARAQMAGAVHPQVTWSRQDEEAWIGGGGHKIHLWTQLCYQVLDSCGECAE